jgi:spore photoproduct lyase
LLLLLRAPEEGFANPITLFVNIEQIYAHISRHAGRHGIKEAEDQIDPKYWVYDIGENGDCSIDAAICDDVKDFVHLFRGLPNAKATFATQVRKPLNADVRSSGKNPHPV